MADNSLQNVIGFFYKIGSTDYPFNSDPNENFGFDVNGSEVKTVFKFSLNDVEKSFSKVRELRQKSYWGNGTSTTNPFDSSTKMNCLLVESEDFGNVDYSPIVSEVVNDSVFWEQTFKAIEFLFENQQSAQSTGSDVWGSSGARVNTYGNSCLFNEKTKDGEDNPFYCSRYDKDSLVMTPHVGSARLSYVKFNMINDDGRKVQFTVYFYADDFIARSNADGSAGTYYVYRYNDTNGDAIISDEEFKNQIIKILFENTGTGKYKSWSSYIVDKRLSDTVYTSEQYFVFSTIAETITDEMMKTQIKNYLRKEYSTQGSDYEALLRYTYPTLFTENTISIYPMWTNKMAGSSGDSKDIHPINLNDIVKEITAYYDQSTVIGDARSKNCQIFYVGPGAGWNPNVEIPFIKPLLAVEEDNSSGIENPISDRFPDYQPIYGQDKNGDSAEFHFILITILNVLEGKSELDSSFKNEFEVDDTGKSGLKKIIKFVFAGNTWQVFGPSSASE